MNPTPPPVCSARTWGIRIEKRQTYCIPIVNEGMGISFAEIIL